MQKTEKIMRYLVVSVFMAGIPKIRHPL